MILSIITPYYNTLEYTKVLSAILKPQLNDKVEWIIVDDGCNEAELDNLCDNVIHLEKNSGNASVPRNVGLDAAKGKYIAFIDSDDRVSSIYIYLVLRKIEEEDFDYCYISWKTGDTKYVIEDEPPIWNTCVWNCIYKREAIGDVRFDPKRNLGEDTEFNNQVRKGKRANIKDIIYFYNWRRPDSLTTNYREGKIPFTEE